jgi:hypothetical protein
MQQELVMAGKIITLLILLISVSMAHAQTGIGTTTPNASAKLDVSASDKGFLPPRIALTASNVASPITSPANGLLVYNTATAGTSPNNVIPGYYFWNGSAWINMIGSTTASTITGNGTTSTLSNFSSVMNDQTSSYTLSNIDNGKVITFNSATTVTLTVPALSVGFNCLIIQKGAGQVILSASSSTIYNRYNYTKTAGQYAIATLVSIASGVYVSSGDMTN